MPPDGTPRTSLAVPAEAAHHLRAGADPELAVWEHPTLFGNRMIAHSGATVSVQGDPAPYGTSFTPWVNFSASGLDVRRTDIAANGQLSATELEQWDAGGQTVGSIAMVAIQGVDQSPMFPAAVDCLVPTTGVATDASLSLDATRIAWTDDDGLKVAGTPTTNPDPCVLTSPPVVISPKASQGAIGGANIAAFLPASGQGPGAGPPPTGGGTAPLATLPRKVTTKGLARAKGVPIKVKVDRAGKVKLSGSVPAKVLGGKGKPIVIPTGSTTAARAGTVTVRLRLTATGRKKRNRLKGARMTLRVTQGRLSTTKRVTLR